MPALIAWGLGIPFFALVLMVRQSHKLESLEAR